MHHNHSVIIVQRASDQIIYFSLHLSINLESFLTYFPLLNTLCLKALVPQQSKDLLVQLTNKCKFKSEQPGYRATGWIHLTEGYGGEMSLGPLLTLQPTYCSGAWCLDPVFHKPSVHRRHHMGDSCSETLRMTFCRNYCTIVCVTANKVI